MSINRDTKDMPKSDVANSDISIVDVDSANTSGETACWKRSSPANKIINFSPTFINTPSPINSPSPEKPISRLKRIILAPNQPNSPKRFNQEIKMALGKLRPINKYNFDEPSGSSPNTNFSATGTKFTACGTSTPRKRAQGSIPKINTNKTQPSRNIQILENTIIKKAPNLSVQEQQSNEQILNNLQGQRLSLQHQLTRIEEQLQHKEQQPKPVTPPLPQASADSHKNDAQHTPPCTPSPKNGSYNPLLTPPPKTPILPPPSIAQQQKEFEHQLKTHIANTKNSNKATTSPLQKQSAFIPWATQLEDQQQKLLQLSAASKALSPTASHSAEPELTPAHNNLPSNKVADQINNILPKPLLNKASIKIPSVFIPKIASIERLTSIIDSEPHQIQYTTTSIQDGGVRVKCKDADSYSSLLQLLQKQNILLHTHQKPEDKGLRLVIRNLHASTSTSTIRSLLSSKGYEVKYANVLKNRFTGIPLNMFEIEIDCKNNPQIEQILSIKRLGNQEVTIERQARRTDPVQCHRCQAFGHSKNYCRRAFVCLKCAGSHPSTDCKKDKSSPGLCANCGNQHIASYKGCPVYKAERSKLLAVKLSVPPPTHSSNYPATTEQHQPPLKLQEPKPVQKNIPTDSKQLTDTRQYNSTNTNRQNWQPLQQRPNKRQANMPAINPFKQINNNPILAQNFASEANYQKTYSQTAYEATVKSPLKLPIKIYTPAPSVGPRPTQTPLKHPRHHLLQLQQQKNRPQAKNNIFSPQQSQFRMTQSLRHHNDSQEIKDIKLAVANNEQSIIKLGEKVDILLKLISQHFKQIPLNINKANDIENEQQ